MSNMEMDPEVFVHIWLLWRW